MSNNNNKLGSNNQLKDLLLLFAIPIAIAVFAAAVIYVPRLFVNPKYDFIYSTCDDYSCRNSYSIDSTGYVSQDYSNSSNSDYYNRTYNRTASLRYYDSSNDSTRSLTLEEARRYHLNTSSKSPDGYTLARESSSSGFLFWGDYDEGWYLKNGAKKKKVELTTTGSYYSRDARLLGWVNE